MNASSLPGESKSRKTSIFDPPEDSATARSGASGASDGAYADTESGTATPESAKSLRDLEKKYKRPALDRADVIQPKSKAESPVYVDSEIAPLERLMIHSPDAGIGLIGPAMATDLLFEDIVDLGLMRREYDVYVRLLLHFLDPASLPAEREDRNGFVPGSGRRGEDAIYFDSPEVLDLQHLLFKILSDPDREELKHQLVDQVCRLEGCDPRITNALRALDGGDLSKTLITGTLPGSSSYQDSPRRSPEYLFSPVPNMIYTRDLGLVVKDHVVLGTSAKRARKREGILAKFVMEQHLFRDHPERLVTLEEDKPVQVSEYARPADSITIEGGDLMMIHPRHLLIGCSERTSDRAVSRFVEEIFRRRDALGIDKISAIHIPKRRASMHIDTVFTMVRRDTWVAYAPLLDGAPSTARSWPGVRIEDEDPVRVSQYHADYDAGANPRPLQDPADWLELGEPAGFRQPACLRDLLVQISRVDFGMDKVDIIPCGGGTYPWDQREQWTDGANLLALREGVVLGYERNRETAKAFQAHGFTVVAARDLIRSFARGSLKPADIRNTLITLRGSELVRARGGTHCMSFPLRRRPWK